MLGSREAKDGKHYAIQTNSWNMKVMFDDDCQKAGITLQILHRNESVIRMSVCLCMWMEDIFWGRGFMSYSQKCKGKFLKPYECFLIDVFICACGHWWVYAYV
jgi:hypothetical protein